jgi:hypothetical protein
MGSVTGNGSPGPGPGLAGIGGLTGVGPPPMQQPPSVGAVGMGGGPGPTQISSPAANGDVLPLVARPLTRERSDSDFGVVSDELTCAPREMPNRLNRSQIEQTHRTDKRLSIRRIHGHSAA